MTEEAEPTRALRDGLEWLTRAPWYAATTWGPYYEALNPPRRVHFIVNWKVVPKRMDHAAKLWQQRQELLRVYEAAHGRDPGVWPAQHPGIVLGANAVCLGCNWFHAGGRYRVDGVYEHALQLAHHHETANGTFRGDDGE